MASALALLALALPAATTALADVGDDYNAYAQIRDKLRACSLDRTWHHLSDTQRKRCTRYRHLYTLWADPSYSSNSYHVHCRTSKCMTAPYGEPDPRAAIPQGADVYR